MNFPFLLFFVLGFASARGYSHEELLNVHDSETAHRILEENQCNVTLGEVTVSQVRDVGEIFLEPLVENARLSRDILFQSAQYDFRVFKLCSSCRFIEIFQYQLGESVPGDWLTYCSETTYGHTKFQSFLVFLPIERASREIVSGANLRAFLSMPGSRLNDAEAPTNAWPLNFTDTLNKVMDGTLTKETFRESTMAQLVPSMLAASSGSVAIIPDYIGYGFAETNRTFFWPQGYKQSAIVGWLHVREFLHRYTDCSRLDLGKVTLQGYEDGALGAVVAAQGFRRFRTDVLRAFSGNGVLDLEVLIMDAIRAASTAQGILPRTRELLEMAAFSFSWGNPELANTGTGQDLVADAFKLQIIERYARAGETVVSETQAGNGGGGAVIDDDFFNDDTVESNETVPLSPVNVPSALSFLNQDLVTYFIRVMDHNSTLLPCTNFVADLSGDNIAVLCQAIAASSAYPYLTDETTYNWIHDIEFCYGKDDPVIGAAQVETVVDDTNFAEVYDGPEGEVTDTLKPLGSDHKRLLNICGISAGLFYVLQGHMPAEFDSRPQFMSALPSDLAQRCDAPPPVFTSGDDDGVPSSEGDDDDSSGSAGEEPNVDADGRPGFGSNSGGGGNPGGGVNPSDGSGGSENPSDGPSGNDDSDSSNGGSSNGGTADETPVNQEDSSKESASVWSISHAFLSLSLLLA